MTKIKRKRIKKINQDGFYFLKITLYLLAGSLWLKVSTKNGLFIPLPVGLLLCLFFARNERIQIDRKIDYAVILIASIVGFWAPYGIFIQM